MARHKRFIVLSRQLFPLQFQGKALVGWGSVWQVGLEDSWLRYCVSGFECDAVA